MTLVFNDMHALIFADKLVSFIFEVDASNFPRSSQELHQPRITQLIHSGFNEMLLESGELGEIYYFNAQRHSLDKFMVTAKVQFNDDQDITMMKLMHDDIDWNVR